MTGRWPTAAGGPTAAPNFPEIPGCRLLAIAGQGGMGTVYRAEQAAPRRTVAVKVLNQTAASPEQLAGFRHEAETIARLEHPNILPVYGYGEAGGRPYLVLRYLGGSVAGLLRMGPIALPNAARWVQAVAGALAFAHAHGLVHRDVKPSNILLDEAGNAYLTDFGIAAAMAVTTTTATGASTSGGEAIGSAAYMSPEQASGRAADARSDLYSLAVSLFEMLTGQLPYTAETPLGVMVRHISDPIPSARALNPNVPPAVDAFIRRGMAKDPAGRPQTAAEFARLLEQAIVQPAVAAPAAASAAPSPTILMPQSNRAAVARRDAIRFLWVGGVLIAVCLLGALALGAGGAFLAALNQPRGTATPFPTATLPPSAVPTQAGPTPAGQLLADDFSDPNSGFGIPAPSTAGGVAYAEGALRFSVSKLDAEFFSTSGRVKTQFVKIDVDVQQQAGSALGEYGAICRWQDAKNYTAFAISGAGQYKIWQKTDGATLPLIDWTDAPSLAGAGNASHHLTVACAGTHLSLAVDSVPLGQAEDPAPVPGEIALFAGLREKGKLVVEFRRVAAARP